MLRCGVQGLPAAENALVRTLFRLYQHGANDFRWALVDAPPYDAVLVDSSSAYTGDMQGPGAAKAILTVGNTSALTLPNTLARPLRSEMLEAWLLQTQRQFFGESIPAATVSEPQRPATPASNVVNTADAGSYKLLRWPPAAMLRNDPGLIRMATVLSRRPINVSELARVSQQPVNSTYAFLLALRNAGLLQSPAQSRPVPESVAQRPAHSVPKIERSLMSRIRLRLGL